MDQVRRCGAGGILGLARLLTEHGEALEADLLRHYRVDLLDLWRGRLTWRRLNALVRGLPPDSATLRAASGDNAGWGLLEHLVARLVDEVAAGNWWAVNKHLKPGQRSRPPQPVPRPGVARRERPQMTPGMASRLLALSPRRDDG